MHSFLVQNWTKFWRLHGRFPYKQRTKLRDFLKSHVAPESRSLIVVANQPWPLVSVKGKLYQSQLKSFWSLFREAFLTFTNSLRYSPVFLTHHAVPRLLRLFLENVGWQSQREVLRLKHLHHATKQWQQGSCSSDLPEQREELSREKSQAESSDKGTPAAGHWYCNPATEGRGTGRLSDGGRTEWHSRSKHGGDWMRALQGTGSDRRAGRLPASWQCKPAMLAIPCSDRDSMRD